MILPPPSYESIQMQIMAAQSCGDVSANIREQIGRLSRFLEDLCGQVVPEKAPDFSDIDCMLSDAVDRAIMLSRLRIVRGYGMWSLVDSKWTGDLAGWIGERKCLEVMSGAGWLAKALSEHGVRVIATDFDASGRWGGQSKVHPVELLDALTAISRYPDVEVLLVSWPPYNNPVIEQVAKKWGAKRPIAYIGEACGGCTATEVFCKHFSVSEKLTIPRWPRIHDEVMLGHYLAH